MEAAAAVILWERSVHRVKTLGVFTTGQTLWVSQVLIRDF
jgi:hypothetical protein